MVKAILCLVARQGIHFDVMDKAKRPDPKPAESRVLNYSKNADRNQCDLPSFFHLFHNVSPFVRMISA